ncbi:MAG: SAM-dependent methyltransferase [Gammaproteobacteria bacterium]|jgi:SAM-dependent methyltransferase
MQFNAVETRRTYSDRSADDSWREWCRETLAPLDTDVVDIGCGGGIYSMGFADLGARSVTGVDQSRQYVDVARRSAGGRERISFCEGSANATGLANNCADIVFERALIHHLSDEQKLDCALEAKRLLKSRGLLCVQDRTFEDVQAVEPAHWIRSTLIDAFPRLLAFEKNRRPSRSEYSDLLSQCGFGSISVLAYQEVRRTYETFDELRQEILTRKGKSILFELSDEDLRRYCSMLQVKSESHPLIECDLWTVWMAST